MENRKYYLAAITAFVIWGFFTIPLRALIEYTAGEILYFRILLSFIVLGAIIPLSRRNELKANFRLFGGLSGKQRFNLVFLTLAGGLLLTVNWLTFIYIVNNINVKTASFAYLVCPVITAVLGFLLLKERLTRIQWISVLVCALSCVVIGMNSALELGYSMLTAGTYALYLVSQRKNLGFDRMIVLGAQVLFSLLILTAIFPFLVDQTPVEPSFYIIIFVIAVVFTVIPLYLNLFALNKINSATIGILMYLNPLFNFTIAFVVFNEKISWLQIIGYVLIVFALVMFNYQIITKRQMAADSLNGSRS